MPDFFVKLLTDEGDLVVDPFGGSNTTGMVAEGLARRWIAVDEVEEYLEASKFRFSEVETGRATDGRKRIPASDSGP